MVDRLTQTVDRLREEISMYEAQCLAQLEETKAAQQALSEAITEIEVGLLCVSKKYQLKSLYVVVQFLTLVCNIYRHIPYGIL